VRKIKAKVSVIEANKVPPLEVYFNCPVCGNEIAFLINPETEEILEIYSDMSEEAKDHTVSCGVCNSTLEWKITKQIVNPSRRKAKRKLNEV
jgi:transcription elongation factor Elf1